MMTTLSYAIHVLFFFFFFLFIASYNSYCSASTSNNVSGESSVSLIVPIGVVLDLNSSWGLMAKLCLDMAVSDFYKAHPNYTTKLQLHTRNADSVLDVNFAALDLLEHENVQGIIGPQGLAESTLLEEVGRKVHVPIISFVAQSSSISYPETPSYFVRITPDDAVQAQALAAICQKYQWSEVAVLYEDTNYGHQFLSDLSKALQEVEIRLASVMAIPSSANDGDIMKELNKLKTKQTRIFLVHMSPSLGFRLFTLAKSIGVMSEGYAWLISDSLSIFMNSLDPATRDSMEGVIGIRPHVNHSKELQHFQERFKRSVLLENSTVQVMELNIYGLWAYDVVTALATALERLMPMNFTSLSGMDTVPNNLRVSAVGGRLLNELLSTTFSGLSGEFQLIDGKMKLLGFEIFNVFGTGEKTIGFWTPERGVIREWSSTGDKKELKRVLWPGDSHEQPKGWDIPSMIRVGIPWKGGFTEFVNVTTDPTTKHVISAIGFSIDIFLAALKTLPFQINYTFHCYNESNDVWSYDDMLNKIPQEYDMVVGDVTIWSHRANYVDFTLPYSESGVVLVVKNQKPLDMWIFVRPLRWDLWLTIIVACILMGIVIRILEHHMPNHGVDSMVTTHRDRHLGMVYWSPVAVLAFPERNMVSNSWSFFVLVFWLFMAFILMQSYTANLSAILTLDQLKFAFSDNYYIGWQEGSVMTEFLTKRLHIDRSRLKGYSSTEEYHKAMSKGSENGGIDAIFDEIPYMKLFLNKYDSRYKIVGPTYRTGGFGFAFPKRSPLVQHFSKAILDVTQDPKMTSLEQKNFGPGYSSQDPLSSKISQQTSSLTPSNFAGLFVIVASVTIFALFCSETAIGRNLTDKTRHFLHNMFGYFRSSNENSVMDASDDRDSIEGEGEDSRELHVLNNTAATVTGNDANADVTAEADRHEEDEVREASLSDEHSNQ